MSKWLPPYGKLSMDNIQKLRHIWKVRILKQNSQPRKYSLRTLQIQKALDKVTSNRSPPLLARMSHAVRRLNSFCLTHFYRWLYFIFFSLNYTLFIRRYHVCYTFTVKASHVHFLSASSRIPSPRTFAAWEATLQTYKHKRKQDPYGGGSSGCRL